MTNVLTPVTLSAQAAREVQHIMTHKNIPEGYGLRVGVRGGGGCGAGMSFMLGFDKRKEDDLSYMAEGIPVFVQKKQLMYLMGMEVDFYEGADARGFTFVNPSVDTAVAAEGA